MNTCMAMIATNNVDSARSRALGSRGAVRQEIYSLLATHEITPAGKRSMSTSSGPVIGAFGATMSPESAAVRPASVLPDDRIDALATRPSASWLTVCSGAP